MDLSQSSRSSRAVSSHSRGEATRAQRHRVRVAEQLGESVVVVFLWVAERRRMTAVPEPEPPAIPDNMMSQIFTYNNVRG
jgi:hypothetical protein